MTITATLTLYRTIGNEVRIADETGILHRLALRPVKPGHAFVPTVNDPQVAALIQRYGYIVAGEWQPGTTDFCRTVVVEPHPQRCETCVHGCDCEIGTAGCGHAFCWGMVSDALRHTCPGAAIVARSLAYA